MRSVLLFACWLWVAICGQGCSTTRGYIHALSDEVWRVYRLHCFRLPEAAVVTSGAFIRRRTDDRGDFTDETVLAGLACQPRRSRSFDLGITVSRDWSDYEGLRDLIGADGTADLRLHIVGTTLISFDPSEIAAALDAWLVANALTRGGAVVSAVGVLDQDGAGVLVRALEADSFVLQVGNSPDRAFSMASPGHSVIGYATERPSYIRGMMRRALALVRGQTALKLLNGDVTRARLRVAQAMSDPDAVEELRLARRDLERSLDSEGAAKEAIKWLLETQSFHFDAEHVVDFIGSAGRTGDYVRLWMRFATEVLGKR